MSFSDDSGQPVELSVEIRTRGNYRRQKRICPFAPLRLDFRKSEVKDTLFDKQDKLKLVTHCRNAKQNEQAVIREYIVYRMFNQLTDMSYLVRPLRITYVDTEKDGRENTRFGFLIESKERLGKRTGWSEYEIGGIDVGTLEPGYSNLVGVFQYFAGNTDFSMISSPDDDDCCHNTQLFGDETQAIAVPYDFDQSGLVDAAYASPNPRLDLRSNRDRLHRGRCSHVDELEETLAIFRAERDALYALIDDEPELTEGSRKGMKRFLNRFYNTLDKPKAVERELTETCDAP